MTTKIRLSLLETKIEAILKNISKDYPKAIETRATFDIGLRIIDLAQETLLSIKDTTTLAKLLDHLDSLRKNKDYDPDILLIFYMALRGWEKRLKTKIILN